MGEKRKNFKKFMGAYLIALIVAAIGACTLIGCDRWPRSHSDNYDTADTTLIAQQVEAIVNPEFTTVEEVIQFRHQTDQGFVIDSIFRSIPEQVLANVATVIIKKHGTLTKKTIAEEYRANMSVYDNLPTSTTALNQQPKEVDLSSTDLGNRRDSVIATSYSYRTDTINGKPVKIQIKKEERYVE